MIEYMADKVTAFIKRNTNITNDMEEAYHYGTELIISSIINICLIITCSLILNEVIGGLIFLLIFIPLRQYTGGYHANTYFKCNFYFTLSFLSVLLLAKYITPIINLNMLISLLLIGFIPIYIFSPVENKYKKLTLFKAKKCRQIAITMYIVLGFLLFPIITFNKYYGTILVFTITTVSILILIGICVKRRKEGEQ